jgi:hypothetical protein
MKVVTKEERQGKKPLSMNETGGNGWKFARAYVNKPIDFWKTVLFTDESKFNIYGSDGPQYVW